MLKLGQTSYYSEYFLGESMLVFLRHCFESVSYDPISGYAQPYSSSEATYATMYGNPEAAYAAYGSAEATYAGAYVNSDAYSTTNQVC